MSDEKNPGWCQWRHCVHDKSCTHPKNYWKHCPQWGDVKVECKFFQAREVKKTQGWAPEID